MSFFTPLRPIIPLLAAAPLLVVGAVQAAVTYSGVVDIPIATSFNGVYLDIATAGTSTPPADPDGVDPDRYTIGYSQPTDWDVNFFFGGIGIAYSDTFQPFVDDTVSNRSQILNVVTGTVIESEAAARTLGINSYGGSGRSNGGTGESHFDTPDLDGPTYSAFSPGSEGYIAFVLNPGGSEQYGWMRVTLENDGSAGTIHDWAYSDDITFTVGQVPEPGSLILVLLGSFGLFRRRREPISRR